MANSCALQRRTFAFALGAALAVPSAVAAPQSGPTNEPFGVLDGLDAAGTALSVLSMFVGGGGSAMEAMLRTQLEYSKLIIEQLAQVQLELAKLSEQVGRLEIKMRRLIMDQLTEQHTADILSVASDYQQYLVAGRADPKIWERKEIRLELAKYIDRLQRSTGILSESSAGWGPESSLIVPLASALEISIQLRRGSSRQVIDVALSRYIKWLENILSKKPRSIYSEILYAIEEHDRVIAAAGETSIGEELRIQEFRIGGSQLGGSGIHACALLGKGGPPEDRGEVTKTERVFRNWGIRSATYSQLSKLVLQENSKLGAMYLQYEPSVVYVSGTRLGGNPWLVDGFPPSESAVCKNIATGAWPFPQSNSKTFRDAVTNYVEERAWIFEWFERRRAKLLSSINLANSYRGRIAYCYSAATLAGDARRRITSIREEYRTAAATQLKP